MLCARAKTLVSINTQSREIRKSDDIHKQNLSIITKEHLILWPTVFQQPHHPYNGHRTTHWVVTAAECSVFTLTFDVLAVCRPKCKAHQSGVVWPESYNDEWHDEQRWYVNSFHVGIGTSCSLKVRRQSSHWQNCATSWMDYAKTCVLYEDEILVTVEMYFLLFSP